LEAGRVDAQAAERRRFWIGMGTCVAVLTLLTWAHYGYRFGIYPQTGFLDWVYRLRGDFSNDFHTDMSPVHWAFSQFLAAVPDSLLEPVNLVIWIGGLAVLWAGFLAISRSLGATLPGGLAAGLVLIPTGLAGFGTVTMLFGYTYPTATSFAFVLASLAALLRSRIVLAGALLGFATLIHPNVGVLATAAMGPALLYAQRDRLRRALVEFGVPWAILSFLSIYQLLANQVSGAELSESDRFDLLTVVRAPHHYDYTHFATNEVVWTGLWIGVLVVALASLWRPQAAEARIVAIICGAIGLMCFAGWMASIAGGPLPLVSAQTARMSAMFVVLGGAASAARLSGAHRVWGPAGLAGAAALTPFLAEWLEDHWSRYADYGSVSAVAAVLVLLLLGAVPLARPAADRLRWLREPGLAAAAMAVLLVGAGVAVAAKDSRFLIRSSPEIEAFVDASEHARDLSDSDDLFLSPPELDGFRSWAHRGTVVEYGTIEFAKGDTEWVRRMDDVTGTPLAASAKFGDDVYARTDFIGKSYDHVIATSKAPICNYDVTHVLVRRSVKPPPWLEPLYRNDRFVVYEVRPGTCSSRTSQSAKS
jgi:hypothetical protein